MANLQKFLDQSGVSVLWDQIVEKINAIPSYDDTQVKTDISNNKAAIEKEAARATAAEENNATKITLLEASVAQQIADEIAKVVGEADESYDTLKEISDWILNHPNEVATLNSSIATNKNAIDSLTALVGNTKVATQISNALVNYYTISEVDAATGELTTKVSKHEENIKNNTTSITNLTSRLNEIIATGGEPNTINTIKVNGVAQVIDAQKAVDIEVPIISALTELEIKSACGLVQE